MPTNISKKEKEKERQTKVPPFVQGKKNSGVIIKMKSNDR